MKTLVHFTADWCQPCKRMQPVIDDVIIGNESVEYIKVNVDNDKDQLNKYSDLQPVMGLPTFWLMESDELKKFQTGVMSKEMLTEFIS
jgi:thioredoxin 1